MLSEIQKRKIHHFFNVLDIDHNGHLQPEDFVNVGKRIIDKVGLSQESRAGKLILIKSHRLFVQLLTDADNPELSLTLWDWIEFFRDQLFEGGNNGVLEYYIHRTSRHIFDLFDMNRDNFIQKEEYSDMLTIYKISQDHAEQSFEELDSNKDGVISVDEMINGLRNFFKSNDVNSPGNLIFGEWR
jgi:Ca2+-binding EF-hand superfamily protein